MILILTIFMLILLVAALGVLDRRVKRPARVSDSLTFIIPCYNDARTVAKTVESLRAVAGAQIPVIVADDGSRPECRTALAEMAPRLGFTLVQYPVNRGKASVLNDCARQVDTELIGFVDADVVVNQRAFADAMARLGADSVGAVSCPFRPINRGPFPLMQQIEYNVLRFIHGSYNLGSAIALWGGFTLVKREAFRAAGGFSVDAIVEDKDLAFKLNRSGWRVQQSFYCMETHVPATLQGWLKQKARWSSGGAQCYFRHWRIWMRNPLHMLFVTLYFGACGFRVWEVVDGVALWDAIFSYYSRIDETLSLADSLRSTYQRYGSLIRRELWEALAYLGLSVPFVLPLLRSSRQLPLLFLFLPFSLLYVPAFTAVSVYGFVLFLRRSRQLREGARAW